jgi:phosphatidylinositol glycan class N
MIVTRSSAISLQAKLGLPRGNQIVGWFILSMGKLVLLKAHLLTDSSTTSAHAIFAPVAAK